MQEKSRWRVQSAWVTELSREEARHSGLHMHCDSMHVTFWNRQTYRGGEGVADQRGSQGLPGGVKEVVGVSRRV